MNWMSFDIQPQEIGWIFGFFKCHFFKILRYDSAAGGYSTTCLLHSFQIIRSLLLQNFYELEASNISLERENKEKDLRKKKTNGKFEEKSETNHLNGGRLLDETKVGINPIEGIADMDAHLRSQMTFVFFCCSSFVMLIVYIALDDSFTKESAISVKNMHISSDTISEVVQTVDRKVKDCLPVQHLAFLPMRQTKSFLLQAIFVHFGLKNHLSFAISTTSNGGFRNGLGHPFAPIVGHMPKIIGYEKEGATYDILCHDMVLDAAKVYEIMPPDTKFIGLLRDPVYHFKALWDAHRHKWSLSNHIEPFVMNDTSNHPLADMQIFLTDPWKFLEQPLAVYQEAELLKGHEFDKKKARTDMTPFISSLLNTRNPQLATYGFEVFSNTLADQLTQSMISSAEAQFQLFLMDEYIDISLAVLKHKLCWSFKEVVTVASALKRPEPKPTYSELGFDDDLVRKLKEFNKADFDFYHRMNQTFWETVHKIGEHKILSITSTIVESAKRLQDKCVENWIKDKITNDFIPVIKESSRHMIECQRIELIRTTSVTKTLQNRQKQMAEQQHQAWLRAQNKTEQDRTKAE